jgi:AAHS family 4-hydroxybenzoate transporter-like MFS transporter
MLGFGRFGGIAGSFLVGELSRRQFGFPDIFMIIAVPGVVAGTALLVKRRVHPRAGAARPLPAEAAAH